MCLQTMKNLLNQLHEYVPPFCQQVPRLVKHHFPHYLAIICGSNIASFQAIQVGQFSLRILRITFYTQVLWSFSVSRLEN